MKSLHVVTSDSMVGFLIGYVCKEEIVLLHNAVDGLVNQQQNIVLSVLNDFYGLYIPGVGWYIPDYCVGVYLYAKG